MFYIQARSNREIFHFRNTILFSANCLRQQNLLFLIFRENENVDLEKQKGKGELAVMKPMDSSEYIRHMKSYSKHSFSLSFQKIVPVKNDFRLYCFSILHFLVVDQSSCISMSCLVPTGILKLTVFKLTVFLTRCFVFIAYYSIQTTLLYISQSINDLKNSLDKFF